MEDKPFKLGSMIYSFVMIVNSDREHLHKEKEKSVNGGGI